MSRETIDYLKSVLPLDEVVGRYTTLKKIGSDRWVGLSPFRAEKNPSFTVSLKYGWADWPDDRKGKDIFDFVMAADNIEFVEALQKLAGMAGLDLKKVAQRRPNEHPRAEFWRKVRRSDKYEIIVGPNPDLDKLSQILTEAGKHIWRLWIRQGDEVHEAFTFIVDRLPPDKALEIGKLLVNGVDSEEFVLIEWYAAHLYKRVTGLSTLSGEKNEKGYYELDERYDRWLKAEGVNHWGSATD